MVKVKNYIEKKTRKPRESDLGFRTDERATWIMAKLIENGVPLKELYRETNKQIKICKSAYDRVRPLAISIAEEEKAEKRRLQQLVTTNLGKKEREHEFYKGRKGSFLDLDSIIIS